MKLNQQVNLPLFIDKEISLFEFIQSLKLFTNNFNHLNDLDNDLLYAILNKDELHFLKLAILYHELNFDDLSLFCCENGGNQGVCDHLKIYKKIIECHILNHDFNELPEDFVDYQQYFSQLLVPPQQLKNLECNMHDKYIMNDDYEIYYYSNQEEDLVSLSIVKFKNESIIIDCGSYVDSYGQEQYIDDLEDFMNKYGVKKDDIKAIIITHAHLDHYGSMDKIYQFFEERVKIYCSRLTKQLLKLVHPSYVVDKLATYNYGTELRFGDIKIKSFQCGHIPGANALLISKEGKNIFFTSDYSLKSPIGTKGLNLLEIPNVDTLVIETTYGDKENNINYCDVSLIFKQIVNAIKNAHKTLFFPAYAIGRTQEIIYILDKLGIKLQVLVSGLAKDVTNYYKNNLEIHFDNLFIHYTKNIDSEYLENYDIIIASSGMLQRHTSSYDIAKKILFDDQFIFFKTGYLKENNQIYQEFLKFGSVIDLSLSAHAQYWDLIKTIQTINPKNVVQIHGKGIKV